MRPVCRHKGGSQGGLKAPKLRPSQGFSLPLHGVQMVHLAWTTGGQMDVTASSWLTSASWASPGEHEVFVASYSDSVAIKDFTLC